MAGLVAVCILSDQAGYVGNETGVFSRAFEEEQWVEFGHESLVATHQVDQALYIVLYMPSVLPRIAFREIAARRTGVWEQEGIERRTPVAFRIFSSHQLEFRIEEILIECSTFGEMFVIFRFT